MCSRDNAAVTSASPLGRSLRPLKCSLCRPQARVFRPSHNSSILGNELMKGHRAPAGAVPPVQQNFDAAVVQQRGDDDRTVEELVAVEC